jgi:hypothetical protein
MENEIKFPHYCCFGKLQQGSVNENAEEITAVYQMFGMKVHELRFNKSKGHWILEEFAPDGRSTLYSCYSTMDKTICFHMNYVDDKEDELLKRLRSELLKLGTVWFAPLPSFKNGDKSITYSPAGKLLAVRLLLSAGEDCIEHLKTIQGLFEYSDPVSTLRLKMHEFYETSCIIQRYDDFNYWHMAFVAEFIVPLAYVYDTVKLLYDRGLLKRNSLNRVFVQDASTLEASNIYEFLLVDIPGAISYAVILKGLLISHEDFKLELKKMEKHYQVESY